MAQRRQKEARAVEEKRRAERFRETRLATWVPKTGLGKQVKNGEIDSFEQIFEKGLKILEPQIVDSLVLDLQEKTMDLKRTARVIRSGRQFGYRATVLVGNKNGFVGVGIANDKERRAAIQKAANQARLNLIPLHRGCGSWECSCGTPHSLPYTSTGRCASVRVKFMPAPRGVGLVVGDSIKEVLAFAGIKDIWCETRGHSRTQLNFVRAAVDALHKTMRMKISDAFEKKLEKK